jgi:hypothetical protein
MTSKMKKFFMFGAMVAIAAVGLTYTIAVSANFSGAIFTSLSTGTGVDNNIYNSKEDVYLNGGPQNSHSAGIPDGLYFFKVTDPNGSTLLSTDPIQCRAVIVANNHVYGTDHVLCSHPEGTPDTTNTSRPVELFPFDDTPNTGGEYKLWLSPDPTFPNNNSKTDNFKIRRPDITPPRNTTYTLNGCKFYDANMNGVRDNGEVGIPGFEILITINGVADDPIFTNQDGCYSRSGVSQDAEFRVEEVIPSSNWHQTAPNFMDPEPGVYKGFADNPPAICGVPDVNGNQVCTISSLDFGNYCELTPGGHTLGFWSNKNGQALETTADFTRLTSYNLRNANGSDRDFAVCPVMGSCSTVLAQDKSALNSWLLGASATNMAYMLSAQMTATDLSVAHGFTTSTVYVDGLRTVAQEITYANSLLANPIVAAPFTGQNGSVTVGGSALRSEQERVKTILDQVNNGASFIQPVPCSVSYTSAVCTGHTTLSTNAG